MLLGRALWLRARSALGARVPAVAVIAAVTLCVAALGVAGVTLAQAQRVLEPRGWLPPVPTNVRAMSAALDAVSVWNPRDTPRSCRAFDDPVPVDMPLHDPTMSDGPVDRATPEPSVLVCDGSGPVVLPSVDYERVAWELSGGVPAAFRPPAPWCELSVERSADIWAPDSTVILACRDQAPVRVPGGGVGVVAERLYQDLLARSRGSV
ncbi:hypothetical protein E3G66_000771 [Mycobacteroides abscessus]|nr:hypothetical protein [Mycobacteroides abscessus]SIM53043.1 Uncharacterised protein [Mycobacteroides abscessus subsp. bolletii]SLB66532.1 Uncharacterised protein [Mycobacteroides abscessus subsp. massiliense]MBE5429205.1 hypothetical protein [Mycobacteroides abscessus]MBE5498251.1 hypothetical protein [Mycobacteroides abscessus]